MIDDVAVPWCLRPAGWAILVVAWIFFMICWPFDRTLRWRDPS